MQAVSMAQTRPKVGWKHTYRHLKWPQVSFGKEWSADFGPSGFCWGLGRGLPFYPLATSPLTYGPVTHPPGETGTKCPVPQPPEDRSGATGGHGQPLCMCSARSLATQ